MRDMRCVPPVACTRVYEPPGNSVSFTWGMGGRRPWGERALPHYPPLPSVGHHVAHPRDGGVAVHVGLVVLPVEVGGVEAAVAEIAVADGGVLRVPAAQRRDAGELLHAV